MAIKTQPPQSRRQREDAMRRVMELPDRDKFEVFEQLKDYLSSALSGESKEDQQLRQRKEALEAMRQVATHLGLKDGEAPTPKQFDQAAHEMSIEWTSAKVIRAYERWRNAKQALLDEWVPRSAAQRTLVRATTGRKRKHEEYLAGVRSWLETEPASQQMCDYDEWAAETNDKRSDDAAPLVKSNALRSALEVGWEQIKSAALGETTLDSAFRRKAALETKGGQEPLVGSTAAAVILGRSISELGTWISKAEFPSHVAKLNGTRVWRRTDIEDFHDGRVFPARREGCDQRLYVDQKEMAELMDKDWFILRRRIWQERWDVVPKPAGKAGRSWYWRRSAVEKWLKTREDA